VTRYFREFSKELIGDRALASSYIPFAAKVLGGLKEMSGGVFSNVRRVILPDGTQVTARFSGAIHQVTIDVTGVIAKAIAAMLRMESGAVYATHESSSTYETEPSAVHVVYGTDCNAAKAENIKLLGRVGVEDNALVESFSSTSYLSGIYNTRVDKNGVFVNSYDQYGKRNTLHGLSGSNFTGLMREFVSAWLGSRPQDIIGNPSPLSTTRSVTLRSGSESRPITESTGIFRKIEVLESGLGDERYWMVDIGTGGAIRYWPVLFGGTAAALLPIYRRLPTGAIRDRMRIYLFSAAHFGPVQTASIESRPYAPLAWGWKFNPDGSKADIILCRSGTVASSSVHWTVDIAYAPKTEEVPEGLSFVLTKHAESAHFVLGKNQMLLLPDGAGIQRVTDFGRSETFALNDGYDPEPDYTSIPIYCFYRGNELCLVTLSASYEEGEYSVTQNGPTDISMQKLDGTTTPLISETITQYAFSETSGAISVGGAVSFSGTGKIGDRNITSATYDGAPNGTTRYWGGEMVHDGRNCLGTTFHSWDVVLTNRTYFEGTSAFATTFAVPLMDAEAVYAGKLSTAARYSDLNVRLGKVIDMMYSNTCGDFLGAGGFVYQYTFNDVLPDYNDVVLDPDSQHRFVLVTNREVIEIYNGIGGDSAIDYFYRIDPGMESRALIAWNGRETSCAYYGLEDGGLNTLTKGDYTKPAGTEFTNFIGWD
jgi:hypothetical protein